MLQNTAVTFNDRENTGNLPGGAAATEPDLILFSPTAVSLQSVGASSQNQGVPLAVFGAVAFLALLMVSITYIIPALRNQKRRG